MSSAYRRILYASTPVSADREGDLLNILAQSRLNNGLDGVSGCLWSTPKLYIQLVEGTTAGVVETFKRIARDPRHSDVTILADEEADERVFGGWAMAGLPGTHPDRSSEKLRELVAGCGPAGKEVLAKLPG